MDVTVGTRPIDEGYIGIGWPHLGDLASAPPSREAFKSMVAKGDPSVKPGSVPVQAGVLYRFVHEMQDGDIVIYPSKIDRMVNIGAIAGKYIFDTRVNAEYPNIRPVKWLRRLSRDSFSQAALYEIGSFITLFSVQKHVGEFLATVDTSSSAMPQPDAEEVEDDAVVSKNVALQAEETTQDFLIRNLKSGLDPYEFEHFVAHLLSCMGYHTRVTQKSGDGGVDIIAHKDKLGFEPPIIKVQCKQVTSQSGRPEVTQLLGNVESGEHGLFVTLGSFTKEALSYDRSKPNLRLIDGEQLVDLILSNYENFDTKYKTLLPLKRIYVPG